ncbi:MAG: hypothetical protein KF757_03315 [Phycisphaeraceae bacterium]|nr:hypothetical protein [Phycisphaeraceae bacterium]MCW5763034.1 hypothetical protein [Phycisphaeraceae bacterium]
MNESERANQSGLEIAALVFGYSQPTLSAHRYNEQREVFIADTTLELAIQRLGCYGSKRRPVHVLDGPLKFV